MRSGRALGREAQNRRCVSSIQGAIWLWWQGQAPHLSLVYQAWSGRKPMSESLRKTIEVTGASRWTPMVLMAKGQLGNPISIGDIRGRLCLGNGTDGPKYRAGLWLAPVKRSLSVQSQEMVSSPRWSSARGHGSQSLTLFDPPARYLSSAFSFSGLCPRLVKI